MKFVFMCKGDGVSQPSVVLKFSRKYQRRLPIGHKPMGSVVNWFKQTRSMRDYPCRGKPKKICLMKQQQEQRWIIEKQLYPSLQSTASS
jgi:hypothetical protein